MVLETPKISLLRLKYFRPYRAQLKKQGITTTQGILEQCATQDGRHALSQKTGILISEIEKLSTLSDLIRIKGVSEARAEMLAGLGIKTLADVQNSSPKTLFEKIKESPAGKKSKLNVAQISGWIAAASALEQKLFFNGSPHGEYLATQRKRTAAAKTTDAPLGGLLKFLIVLAVLTFIALLGVGFLMGVNYFFR